MAAVDIINMKVLSNPAPFPSPLQFEITYEVRETLLNDIEWRVLYVGSADSSSYDQELESVLVPADTTGSFSFLLETPAPDPELIPKPDLLGVTILLVTASYGEAEFIRVGYYVNNAFPNDPEKTENPPAVVDVAEMERTILSDEPRVTRFTHKFDYVNPLGGGADEAGQNGMEGVEKAGHTGSWEDPMVSRDATAVEKVGKAAFAMMNGTKPGLNPFEVRGR